MGPRCARAGLRRGVAGDGLDPGVREPAGCWEFPGRGEWIGPKVCNVPGTPPCTVSGRRQELESFSPSPGRRAAVPVRADPVRGDPPTSPRPKRIAHVELIPEGPHCGVQEVVVTRKDSEKVCLEPTAPWVKLIVTKILSR
ncbi:unnamed protein product, partial [Natator depressus]